MATQLIKPGTCQTCPFREKEAGKLYCHANPPTPQALLAVMQGPNGPVPQIVFSASLFPVVEPQWWCGRHPTRRKALPAAAQPDDDVVDAGAPRGTLVAVG